MDYYRLRTVNEVARNIKHAHVRGVVSNLNIKARRHVAAAYPEGSNVARFVYQALQKRVVSLRFIEQHCTNKKYTQFTVLATLEGGWINNAAATTDADITELFVLAVSDVVNSEYKEGVKLRFSKGSGYAKINIRQLSYDFFAGLIDLFSRMLISDAYDIPYATQTYAADSATENLVYLPRKRLVEAFTLRGGIIWQKRSQDKILLPSICGEDGN